MFAKHVCKKYTLDWTNEKFIMNREQLKVFVTCVLKDNTGKILEGGFMNKK